ncbi:ComEA family DNA-binding protein [Actinomadura miaoliensis]|uniref:Helix-hairpin-helix DNA-binding motif class 1 domain-containing protein n=1 Tax=Actinomadura miaoliensis TaxID=430685 RepID=A0ABP7W229_9ACTN
MLGRLDPGAGGVRALVLVALVAALVAAGYLWMARPRPVAEAGGRPALVAGSSAPAAPAPTAAGGQGAPVMVHVYGKVRRPGVVTLPGGSRVADAIKAAGGVRPGAGTGALNLARKVVDGEQIAVGVRAPSAAPTPAATPGGAAGASAVGGAQLDLNTASVDQLDQLPGVGPVLAQRIVDYRTQHGAFRSVEQLQEVSGIGERRFADLKRLVRV